MRILLILLMTSLLTAGQTGIKAGLQFKVANGVGPELNLYPDQHFFLSFSAGYLLLLASVSAGAGVRLSPSSSIILRYSKFWLASFSQGSQEKNLYGPELVIRFRLFQWFHLDLGGFLLRKTGNKSTEPGWAALPSIGVVLLF